MEYIRLTVEGPIAVVTIHRPACRNALNSQVYREIIAALQDVRDRDDVRVVLLTGAGDKAFAAGADIAQMVQESPQSGRRNPGGPLQRQDHRRTEALDAAGPQDGGAAGERERAYSTY